MASIFEVIRSGIIDLLKALEIATFLIIIVWVSWQKATSGAVLPEEKSSVRPPTNSAPGPEDRNPDGGHEKSPQNETEKTPRVHETNLLQHICDCGLPHVPMPIDDPAIRSRKRMKELIESWKQPQRPITYGHLFSRPGRLPVSKRTGRIPTMLEIMEMDQAPIQHQPNAVEPPPLEVLEPPAKAKTVRFAAAPPEVIPPAAEPSAVILLQSSPESSAPPFLSPPVVNLRANLEVQPSVIVIPQNDGVASICNALPAVEIIPPSEPAPEPPISFVPPHDTIFATEKTSGMNSLDSLRQLENFPFLERIKIAKECFFDSIYNDMDTMLEARTNLAFMQQMRGSSINWEGYFQKHPRVYASRDRLFWNLCAVAEFCDGDHGYPLLTEQTALEIQSQMGRLFRMLETEWSGSEKTLYWAGYMVELLIRVDTHANKIVITPMELAAYLAQIPAEPQDQAPIIPEATLAPTQRTPDCGPQTAPESLPVSIQHGSTTACQPNPEVLSAADESHENPSKTPNLEATLPAQGPSAPAVISLSHEEQRQVTDLAMDTGSQPGQESLVADDAESVLSDYPEDLDNEQWDEESDGEAPQEELPQAEQSRPEEWEFDDDEIDRTITTLKLFIRDCRDRGVPERRHNDFHKLFEYFDALRKKIHWVNGAKYEAMGRRLAEEGMGARFVDIIPLHVKDLNNLKLAESWKRSNSEDEESWKRCLEFQSERIKLHWALVNICNVLEEQLLPRYST